MWSPDQYLQDLYEKTTPRYTFQASNKSEWEKWRTGLREAFIRDLGGFPAVPADLQPTIIEEEIESDGYTRHRVEITTYAGMRMPMYVLLPTNRKAQTPAVIALHGHGYGSREIIGLNPDGTVNEGDPTYQNNFALSLVKQGLIVVAPEILGFGDRRVAEHVAEDKYSSCDVISKQLLHYGQNMAGHRVYDAIRAVDYLFTRSDVQHDQIGSMGISGGGLVCSFASALDERVKAVAVSGYVNTFKDSILGIDHCVDNYIPGLHHHAEIPDIVGMIAPRALYVESGTRDPIFPIEATRIALQKISRVYELCESPEKLTANIFEGEHVIDGTVASEWMGQQLSL